MLKLTERIKHQAIALLILIIFLIPIIPSNLSSRTIVSSTNSPIPSLPKLQVWDPAGDFYKGLNGLLASGNRYGYWLPSNMPSVYAATTFGILSTGSTSYPTTTDSIGSSASSVNQNNQLLGYPITPSQSGVLTSVGLNVMTAAGNIRTGIYRTLTGTSTFSGLLGQSASVSVVSGWNDAVLTTPVSIVKGTTYFIVFVLSDNSCVYYANTSGTQYKLAFTYAPFPDPTGTLSTAAKTAYMRITYSGITGNTRGTRVQYTDTTGGTVTSFRFYTSTGGSSDHFTLAFYDDNSGNPNHRLWYSASTGSANTTWNVVNYSSGTPDNGWTGTLTKNAYYWFMWQWDKTDPGPSYTAGSANTGIYLVQPYGTILSTWSGGTLSNENWSMYLTYTPPSSTTSTNSGTTTTSSSQTITESVGSSASSVNQNNQLLGYPITPSQSGVLTSVGLNVMTAAGNIRIGIYTTYSNSKFSGLLGQSQSVPVVSGWNDVALTAPVYIVGGTTYFIVFVLSDNSCVYYANTSGTQYKLAFTYAPFPDPTGTLSTAAKTAYMRITYSTTSSTSSTTASTTSTSTTSTTRTSTSTGSTSMTSTGSTSMTWVSQACTYQIFTDGTKTYLQDCKTGSILYSSASAYLVFDDALTNLAPGGTLLTKAGVYVISNTIYGRYLSSVTWLGEGWGTILQAHANIVDTAASYKCGGGYHIDLICIYGGTGVTVTDMQLDGNAPNQSGAGANPGYVGIEAEFASHITLDHLYVHNFKTDGMQFAGTSDSVMSNNYVANNRADGVMETAWTPPYSAARNTFRANTINGSSDVGISIYGSDTLIEGNVIVNMTTTDSPFGSTTHQPILIGDNGNASRITVRDNLIQNNPGWAIMAQTTGGMTQNYDLTIDGNHIIQCYGGIDITYTDGVTISNNVIQSTTNANVPYGGIKLYTGTTDISITGNLIQDSASYGLLNQAGTATISGNTIIMTNRAAAGQTGMIIMANNNEITNNTVDLSSVTKTMTGILLSPDDSSNVASGNTVTGNPSNLLGSGITLGGVNDAILDNQVRGFAVCINTSGTPDKGLIADNVLSSSQCTTKINVHGTSMVITGNAGYNPLGHIASPFDNALDTVKDGSGTAAPNNATTMTVNYSPKVVKVVIGTGWTSTHRLVIKIDGTQIVSTTTPVANTVYSYTLNPGETFYIQYQTGQASFIVSGQ